MTIATFPSYAEIFATPGLVYVNPSALDAEANYGTLLGWLDGPVIAEPFMPTRVVSNHLDNSPQREYLTGKPYWELTCRIVSRSAKALALAFPGQVDANGDVVAPAGESPVTFLPGVNLVTSAYCNRLLFMPEDEGVHHPIWLAQFALGRVVGRIERGMQGDGDQHHGPDLHAPSELGAHGRFFDGAKANALTAGLSFTVQPPDTTAATVLSPSVVVASDDAGFTGSITVTLTGDAGTLSGTTVKAAVSGVATFDDIEVDSQGDFQLVASAAAHASKTSDTFTIAGLP